MTGERDALPADGGGKPGGNQGPTAIPVLLPPIVLLRDLNAQLLWPGLLRVPAVGLWPSRLVLGVLGALLVGLIGSLSSLWSDKPAFVGAVLESQAGAWGRVPTAVLAGDVESVAGAMRQALIESPAALLSEYPVSTLVLLPVMIGVVVAVGGAICRSVAVEGATQRRPSGPRVLGWSLARWPSVFGAVMVPMVAAWILVLLMRGLGWITLGLPVLDVAGGVLFPVQAVLGVATVGLVVGLGTCGVMIVPARMVEDSDAMDAIQRAIAYGVARPLRLMMYLALALGVSVLALGLARALIAGGWGMAVEESAAWISPDRHAALDGVMPTGADGATRAMPTTTRITHWLIGMWGQIPALLLGGYAISLLFTGGTRVYLIMRQVCDGQDGAEIQGVAGGVAGGAAGSTGDGATA